MISLFRGKMIGLTVNKKPIYRENIYFSGFKGDKRSAMALDKPEMITSVSGMQFAFSDVSLGRCVLVQIG